MLAPAAIGVAFLLLPLVGLLLRTPWNGLGQILATADVTQALRLSLWTATVATMISIVLGVPLAWLLALHLGWGQTGVYTSVVIAESCLALGAIWLFRRGRWKLSKV